MGNSVFDTPDHYPVRGDWYKHKKKGTKYCVFSIANGTADSGRSKEFPITVCYVDTNGESWATSYLDFIRRMEYDPHNTAPMPELKS